MLDIVAPQQDQLALPVGVVDVDDAEPRLARAASLAGKRGAIAGEAPQHEREQRQENEDNGEGNDVFGCRRHALDRWDVGRQDATLLEGRPDGSASFAAADPPGSSRMLN